MSDFGKYHADNGAAKALELRDNGDETVNVWIVSDGQDGSGLSAGGEVKFNVPVGNGETGTFTRAKG